MSKLNKCIISGIEYVAADCLWQIFVRGTFVELKSMETYEDENVIFGGDMQRELRLQAAQDHAWDLWKFETIFSDIDVNENEDFLFQLIKVYMLHSNDENNTSAIENRHKWLLSIINRILGQFRIMKEMYKEALKQHTKREINDAMMDYQKQQVLMM